MNRIRTVIFWVHFTCGTVAGLFITIMCATGVALAFEKPVADWAARDAIRVSAPVDVSTHLGLREIVQRARETRDDARPTAVILSSDPSRAVRVEFGRDSAVYVDPAAGDVRPEPPGVRQFFQSVEDWHRALAQTGERRPIGRAISGACNAAFLVLAVTGLYLWMPRRWSWTAIRSAATLRWRLAGRARDFNWHTTLGFWSSPVLMVLTATALPMSYRWANDALYRLAGEAAPITSASDASPDPIAPPTPDARPLSQDALLAKAQMLVPEWETITLRLGGGRRTEGAGARSTREEGQHTGGRRGAMPVAFTIRTKNRWPTFASINLTLNPYTGDLIQRSDSPGADAGRRWRSWARFLHTGEAFGLPGQAVAAAGALGGVILVLTGLTLAMRRLFGRGKTVAESAGSS